MCQEPPCVCGRLELLVLVLPPELEYWLSLDPKKIEKLPRGPVLYPKDLIQRLRERHAEEKSLSSYSILNEDTTLSNAMIYRFGSHVKALEAAGFDATEMRNKAPGFTQAEKNRTIKRAREIARMTGDKRYQAVKAFRKKYRRIFRAYNNWIKFSIAAGIPCEKLSPLRYPTKEEIEEKNPEISTGRTTT